MRYYDAELKIPIEWVEEYNELLGESQTPPKVDCRVWAEDSYQEVLEILREVRTNYIETCVNGEAPLLPQKLRKRIHEFLFSNGL